MPQLTLNIPKQIEAPPPAAPELIQIVKMEQPVWTDELIITKGVLFLFFKK